MHNLNPITMTQLFEMPLQKPEYVIKPFLPQKGLIEIYAPAGVGKTTFALTLSIAAATGTSFMKWDVNHSWRVLYVDGEMNASDMKDRIKTIAGYFNYDPKEITNFKYLSADLHGGVLPDIGSVYNQSEYEDVFDWAEIIVLDNLSTLWLNSRENDADAWSPIRAWKSKIKASGRTVISIHHAGKNGSSRGTSKRHDAPDTIIKLERPFKYEQKDGAVFEVQFEKSRGFFGKDAEPVGLKYSIIDGVANWESFIIGHEKYDQIAEFSKQGLTQQSIAEQLGLSQGEVSKRLKAAAAKGLL